MSKVMTRVKILESYLRGGSGWMDGWMEVNHDFFLTDTGCFGFVGQNKTAPTIQ